MTPDPGFEITPADWPRDEADIRSIRTSVFVVEQGVAPELDFDGLDPACRHVLARESHGGHPLGTGRLDPSGKIGRIAVLESHRRRGIGHALVTTLLETAAAAGMKHAFLHAQVASIRFYESLGFKASGPVFDEAGIPHRRMECPTPSPGNHTP